MRNDRGADPRIESFLPEAMVNMVQEQAQRQAEVMGSMLNNQARIEYSNTPRGGVPGRYYASLNELTADEPTQAVRMQSPPPYIMSHYERAVRDSINRDFERSPLFPEARKHMDHSIMTTPLKVDGSSHWCLTCHNYVKTEIVRFMVDTFHIHVYSYQRSPVLEEEEVTETRHSSPNYNPPDVAFGGGGSASREARRREDHAYDAHRYQGGGVGINSPVGSISPSASVIPSPSPSTSVGNW